MDWRSSGRVYIRAPERIAPRTSPSSRIPGPSAFPGRIAWSSSLEISTASRESPSSREPSPSAYPGRIAWSSSLEISTALRGVRRAEYPVPAPSPERRKLLKFPRFASKAQTTRQLACAKFRPNNCFKHIHLHAIRSNIQVRILIRCCCRDLKSPTTAGADDYQYGC
jgi:hypothetical protein